MEEEIKPGGGEVDQGGKSQAKNSWSLKRKMKQASRRPLTYISLPSRFDEAHVCNLLLLRLIPQP